jgi:peptidoglycan/xylan/chitin deacetylase (PgdA/CDA1 family)
MTSPAPRVFRLGLLAAMLLLALPSSARAEGVALTFDDLPLNGELPPGVTRRQVVDEVLAVLRERGAPQAYGFVNAAKLEGNPDGADALARWVAGGQAVGNHTYSHLDLHQSDVEAFLADVRRDEPALELLDPGGHWRWFRYPYLREGVSLAQRAAVRARLQQRGYRIAQVTLDYEDYQWNFAYARCVARGDAEAIAGLRATYLRFASEYLDAGRSAARELFGRDIQHVLLLHLGSFSGTILPALLDLLKHKGFTLVTLEQAQGDSAYDADADAAARFDGSLLAQLLDARHLPSPPVTAMPYAELEAVCR